MADKNQNDLGNIKEAVAIARLFEKKFRDPKNPSKLKKDLEPSDLFEGLGFNKINFSDLNPNLQKALKTHTNDRWYGHPVELDGKVNTSGLIIMGKKDGSVIYFFRKNKEKTESVKYSCSRLSKMDTAYCVEQLHNNFNIGEIIPVISTQEIISDTTMTGRHCGLKYIEIKI